MERTLVFRGTNRWRALAYAVAGNAVPIGIACLTRGGSHRGVFLAGALGACLAPAGVILIPRRRRVPFYLCAYGGIPSLTAMQAYTGGAQSGYSVLLMMAMVWFGLQATPRELRAGLGVLTVCAVVPMVVFGAPAYPVHVGHAAILVLVGAAVAGSLHTVVREVRRLTERLQREAVTDDLTGLLNRRGWREAATDLLERSDAPALGLLMVDLDGFKELNDTMGHDEGDAVLAATAHRLRSAIRAEDVAARLGGDEFVALLAVESADDVIRAADRLRGRDPERCRFSAGVAVWEAGEGLDSLVRRADVALYEAKTSGGNAVVLAPRSLPPGLGVISADRP